jgi:hypothetical protein
MSFGMYMIKVVSKTLKQFDYDLNNILKNNYLDIILYGSNTLNNFVPHRGDIDFIVILKDDISDIEINGIFNLHDIYRSRKYNNLEYQLEGMYYPVKVLENICCKFVGCYIGTGRKGWKKIFRFQNNVFDLIQMKNNGIYLKGGKINIYEPSKAEIEKYIFEEIKLQKRLIEENVAPPSHTIIQFVARTMYYIETGKIGSKEEACKKYSKKVGNNKLIEKCGKIKYPDDYNEFEINYPEHKLIAKQSLNDLMELLVKIDCKYKEDQNSA